MNLFILSVDLFLERRYVGKLKEYSTRYSTMIIIREIVLICSFVCQLAAPVQRRTKDDQQTCIFKVKNSHYSVYSIRIVSSRWPTMRLHLLVSHTLVALVLGACSTCSVARPCNSPYFVAAPTSVTTRLSAVKLKAAASCPHLSTLLDRKQLQRVVYNAASASYPRRQDLAGLLNAVHVLNGLRTVDVSSIIHEHLRIRRATNRLSRAVTRSRAPSNRWSIALDELYDVSRLTTASPARRSEAIIDLLRILQKSHPQRIFRSLKTFCPDLVDMWERSTLLLLT